MSVLYSCVYGAPRAVEPVHVFGELGTPTVVQIGSCWSLQRQVRTGDVVLAESAAIGEGASQYYGGAGTATATPALVDLAEAAFVSRGFRVHRGSHVTTSALCAQPPERVAAWAEAGHVAVDIETPAVFTAARFFGMQAVSLLFVWDELLAAASCIPAASRKRRHRLVPTPRSWTSPSASSPCKPPPSRPLTTLRQLVNLVGGDAVKPRDAKRTPSSSTLRPASRMPRHRCRDRQTWMPRSKPPTPPPGRGATSLPPSAAGPSWPWPTPSRPGPTSSWRRSAATRASPPQAGPRIHDRLVDALGASAAATPIGVPDDDAYLGSLVIRTEALRLADSEGENVLTGRVIQVRYRGDHVTLDVEVAATVLEMTVPPSVDVAIGQQVCLFLPPDACWVVPLENDGEV